MDWHRFSRGMALGCEKHPNNRSYWECGLCYSDLERKAEEWEFVADGMARQRDKAEEELAKCKAELAECRRQLGDPKG